MKKMTDSERVAKHRRRKTLEALRRDGFASAKEVQDMVREVGVPWTWNSRRKKPDGHVGVEDLLPSRKVADTLRARRGEEARRRRRRETATEALRKRRKAPDGGTGSKQTQALAAQAPHGGQRSRDTSQ